MEARYTPCPPSISASRSSVFFDRGSIDLDLSGWDAPNTGGSIDLQHLPNTPWKSGNAFRKGTQRQADSWFTLIYCCCLLCLSAVSDPNRRHNQNQVLPHQQHLLYCRITAIPLPITQLRFLVTTSVPMATLAPLSATPARQPFGVLDSSKLRSIQSIKNCQNGTGQMVFTNVDF